MKVGLRKAILFVSCANLMLCRGSDAPLPDGQQLKQRVMKSMRQSEKALENYSCLARDQTDELAANGTVKKHRSSLKEQFFVNGIEIEHTLEKDGKPLTSAETKKEQERVDKEVKKYSEVKAAEKTKAKDEKQADIFLRALQFTDGRRELRDKRATLIYKLSGDPNFRPKKLEERFAQSLEGRIWVDEETGTPIEIRFETVRDLKIGGGVLANLHKGFWLHVLLARQPDGVWLAQDVEGSGDVRAALFLRERFRFRETLDKCHLFSVNTQQKIGTVPPGTAEPREH